ncbi:MAG: hypothetical protein ACYT04_60650, partial [Nostoc sp.]
MSRPPVAQGGQDFGVSAQSNAAHPTSSSNLFVESPLSDRYHHNHYTVFPNSRVFVFSINFA